jgi:hypothetical protein
MDFAPAPTDTTTKKRLLNIAENYQEELKYEFTAINEKLEKFKETVKEDEQEEAASEEQEASSEEENSFIVMDDGLDSDEEIALKYAISGLGSVMKHKEEVKEEEEMEEVEEEVEEEEEEVEEEEKAEPSKKRTREPVEEEEEEEEDFETFYNGYMTKFHERFVDRNNVGLLDIERMLEKNENVPCTARHIRNEQKVKNEVTDAVARLRDLQNDTAIRIRKTDQNCTTFSVEQHGLKNPVTTILSPESLPWRRSQPMMVLITIVK